MVQDPIAHGCLVDMADFWIANIEVTIGSMFVSTTHEIILQIKNITLEIQFKFRNIHLTSLTLSKRFPRRKEVFCGDYFPKYVAMYLHTL